MIYFGLWWPFCFGATWLSSLSIRPALRDTTEVLPKRRIAGIWLQSTEVAILVDAHNGASLATWQIAKQTQMVDTCAVLLALKAFMGQTVTPNRPQ